MLFIVVVKHNQETETEICLIRFIPVLRSSQAAEVPRGETRCEILRNDHFVNCLMILYGINGYTMFKKKKYFQRNRLYNKNVKWFCWGCIDFPCVESDIMDKWVFFLSGIHYLTIPLFRQAVDHSISTGIFDWMFVDSLWRCLFHAPPINWYFVVKVGCLSTVSGRGINSTLHNLLSIWTAFSHLIYDLNLNYFYCIWTFLRIFFYNLFSLPIHRY